jgi:hypothetical protein
MENPKNTKIDDLLIQSQKQDKYFLYLYNKKYIKIIDTFDKNSIFFYKKKYRFDNPIYCFRDKNGSSYKFYSELFIKEYYPELVHNIDTYIIFYKTDKYFIHKNHIEFTVSDLIV